MHTVMLASLRTVETPFTMCLTGGEPTLFPHIYDVVKGLAENDMCRNAVLMTNLSRSVEFYKKFADLKSERVVIMASAHPEYVDSHKFVSKSIELSRLSPMRFTAHVCLTDNPDTWQSTKSLLDELISNGVEVKPNVLFETRDSKQEYTDEFYSIFKPYLDNAGDGLIHDIECRFNDGTVEYLKDYEVEMRNLNRFKGYTCRTAAFKITMDGGVYNVCTDRKVSLLMNNKNLIKDEICPKEVCGGRQLLTYPKHHAV